MKRKEAIEVVRSFLNPNHSDIFSKALETLIPELKKSEDEQHRKWILEYLYDGMRKSDEQFKDQFKSAIAWLEKQGQEQPKVSIWKHWKCGLAGNGEGKQIYLIKDGDIYSISSYLSFECDYIELSDLNNLMLEKQEEQSQWKPSEEQINALEHFVRSIGESGYASPIDNNTKLIYSLLNDLKNIRHER